MRAAKNSRWPVVSLIVRNLLTMSIRSEPKLPTPVATGPTSTGAGRGRLSRRSALGALAGLGIGSAAFQRALAVQAADAPAVTAEMIRQAEWVAGLTLSEDERKSVAEALAGERAGLEALRKVPMAHGVSPAVTFFAAPPQQTSGPPQRGAIRAKPLPELKRPADDESLAFCSVTELGAFLRSKQVSSVELAKLALARLERFDPLLHCVAVLTPDLALRQAAQADAELAAGQDRGPLHGIPWGAKDLIAYPGYKTAWGAGEYREQALHERASVAARLDEAGAVLVAKLTLGALAMGDQWYGGRTRNPWNPAQGSSGSSAGSASAVAAGLVPFAIGSETLGSIVSPCRRCSVTGLRPTFGRVSRAGCMTLSWSMDKLGPIARTAEDCALVLGAIHGSDGLDPAAVDRPFAWPSARPLGELRVGYVANEQPIDARPELVALRSLGVQLAPFRAPDGLPVNSLPPMILDVEAATVFDELTRRGVREGIGHWATTFRRAQLVSAVDYLRAQRVRTLAMQAMERALAGFDAYVGGDDLTLTNMTGHPCIVLPTGQKPDAPNGQPDTITLTGRLFGEEALLTLAQAYQATSTVHRQRPPLERLLTEAAGSTESG